MLQVQQFEKSPFRCWVIRLDNVNKLIFGVDNPHAVKYANITVEVSRLVDREGILSTDHIQNWECRVVILH